MTVAHVLALRQPAPGSSDVLEELARVARAAGAVAVHAGANIAPTDHAGGVGFGLVAVFPDHGALSEYLDAPEHLTAAGRLAGEDVVVLDISQQETLQEAEIHL
jgi:hypothetical protein